MRKRDWKRTLCLLLLFLNLAFIWGNSMLPAELSSAFSGFGMELVGWTGMGSHVSAGAGEHLLRKLAHFGEFLLLGVNFSWLFLQLKQKGIHCVTMPLLFGVLTACIDETIQLFSPGRSSSLVDVWIDVGGLSIGMMLFLLGHAIVAHCKKRKQQFGG